MAGDAVFGGQPEGAVEKLAGRGELPVVGRGERERDRVADALTLRAVGAEDVAAQRADAVVQGGGKQAQGLAELIGSHGSLRSGRWGGSGSEWIREHLRAGAEPVEVVEGRHADVIAAETTLKRQRTAPLRKWRTWRMPASFGKGTEVVRVVVPIRLADVLPAGRDVTDRFVDPARHGGTAARLGNRRRG
ncbi:hypothetical protein [Micromonospora sp. RP3T]|uniref:hypothetical protein n=1 Tax=Micromonospora sp. RP3T TaxID=2135446 RepID=UPI003D71B5E7